MRVFAPRSAAYVSNSHIFLLWMVGTSLVLITVAVLFLRNQIRPFCVWRMPPKASARGARFGISVPRGAREVRRAAQAFIEMKRRIERSLEQRTAMLAGVSHDLRTILTRFKLELVLIGDSPEVEAMKKDVDEMGRMLEAYLAFARGDTGEQSAPTDMGAFLEEFKTDTERTGHKSRCRLPRPSDRYGAAGGIQALPRQSRVQRGAPCAVDLLSGNRDHRWLTVTVDDDGPGIPGNCARRCSSRSCGSTTRAIRTKAARGLDLRSPATSRAHMAATSCWADSPMGGLRATVRVPV